MKTLGGLCMGIFALVGLLASVGVHAATVFGVNPSFGGRWVWLLHIGIFPAITPVFLFVQRHKTPGRKGIPLNVFYAGCPRWVSIMGTILIVYTIVNFSVLWWMMWGERTPVERDGRYVVISREGGAEREVSGEEYRAYQARALRMFSGHWMLFYYVPATFLLFRREDSLSKIRQDENGGARG